MKTEAMLAGLVLAFGAVQSSADDLIICKNNSTGALKAAASCSSSETRIIANTINSTCSLGDVAGTSKLWKFSKFNIVGNLTECSFSANSTGAIAAGTNACKDFALGQATNFNAPDTYNLVGGQIQHKGTCTYEITFKLVDAADPVIATARAHLAADKMTMVGSFIVDWGGGMSAGGSFAAARVK